MKNNFIFRIFCTFQWMFIINLVHGQNPYTYPPRVIQGVNETYQELTYIDPHTIISPKDPGIANAVIFNECALVDYIAGFEIKLTDGFTAGSMDSWPKCGNSNFGEFKAYIEHRMDVVVITPDISHLNSTDGMLHVNKWEKLELGFILPPEYMTAVDDFFAHYWINSVDPVHDLNPYAYDSLQVQVILTRPDQTQITKKAFFMREAQWSSTQINGQPDAQLPEEASLNNPLHPYFWRFRFTPDQENATLPWKFTISISAPLSAPSNFPSFTADGFVFMCDQNLSDNHGFLKVNANGNGYLQFENAGEPFFGIGENLADFNHGVWPYNNPYDERNSDFFLYDFDRFKSTLDELSTSGSNFVRLGLHRNTFAPEHEYLGVYDQYTSTPTCDGPNYAGPNCTIPQNPCCLAGKDRNRQFNCWVFDKIVDRLRDDHMYAKLELEFFQPIIAYQTFSWGDDIYFRNYIKKIGAIPPYTTISEYFTGTHPAIGNDPGTADALYYWKRRIAYILNRWGYSVNIPIFSTFNELDQTLSFQDASLGSSNDICCNNKNTFYSKNPVVRNAIDTWHNEIISFTKNPDPQTGLADNNHLWSVDYTNGYLGSVHTPLEYQDYYRLFNNPNIDLIDLHDYRYEKYMADIRYDLLQNTVRDPLKINCNKPFNFGEVGSGNYTAPFYNNYDISFHNMIWSTAMQGSYATGLDWYSPLIHRWPRANPEPNPPWLNNNPPTELGEIFVLYDQITPILHSYYTDKIKSLYHNYKPLYDFNNNSSSYNYYENINIPHKFYDAVQAIESYYLTESNGNYAAGWIHNIEYNWENEYYYDFQNFNWNGCNLPTPSGIPLQGFNSGQYYDISYHYTRMGTPPPFFPQNQFSIQADPMGQLTISAAVLNYLGCDTNTADFAFSIKQQGFMREIQAKSDIVLTTNFGVNIIPNPNFGSFNIYLTNINGNDTNACHVYVFDLSGRLIAKQVKPAINFFRFSIGDASKGCYFIEIKKGENSQFKKIIVQ